MSSEARGAADRRRELVSRMLRRRGIEDDRDAVSRRADPSEHPLSFAQQRLWFLDQLEPGSPRYNMFVAYRMEGTLDVSALERSLSEIVRRHEVLRARFAAVDGEPRASIGPAGPFDLVRHDLEGLKASERDGEVEQLAMEQARRPYDLARGPLVRATLLRLAPREHLLLLGMHHIASDGWSAGLLTRELCALYEAFSQDLPSPLPELKVQYADFAAWQRQWLRGERLDGQVAYWRRQLGGLTTLELPADRPRPPVQTFAGAWSFRALPPGLLEQVRELGQREGATLFMTLLAAYAVLLSRLSGQDDVAIGAPIANRTRAELEGLVGFFANTLVLRSDLSGDPSFLELLRKVRETAIGAYAHQDLPFEKLVEELRPERHMSRNPLFQVALVLQDTRPVEHQLPDLVLRSGGGIDNRISKFDLTLYVGETEPGGLAFDYSTDLFDAATADRMLGQLQTLLEAVVEAPDRCIADLPLLSAEEWRRTVREWNDTRVEHRGPVSLHEAVDLQSERTPAAEAVVFGERALSYGELERRANQLANHLLSLSLGPEARVGVFVERSLELPVALLGTMKANAAWVPLDPSYPRERLAFMIADARLDVVLTLEHLVPALPESPAAVVRLDADWPVVARAPGTRPALDAGGDRLAYVIYTSGSTGAPKGVMVPHAAILNHMLWMQATFPLSPDDRVLQKTTLNFDAAVWECFAPLMAGARLVLARPEGQKDTGYLVDAVRRHGITVLKLVPSLLEALTDEPGLGSCGTLRLLLCGGEALSPELAARVAALLPGAELHNLYGPTETAVDVTSGPARGARPGGTIPIGRPIHNTRAHVLDARLRPAPVGVAGELHIGGANLARGYLGRPDLTAEKFVPDPFGGEAGARLYRTGDRVLRREDGQIEFLGRMDRQVKLRGFRVEPGEIEAVLLGHGSVKDAVVVVREDEPGDVRLVGYVTGRVAEGPGVSDLRAHVSGRLPEYMVPAAFVVLESLPLNPNGKVDRRALPAPERERGELAQSRPRTPVEEGLAAIWSQVLGVAEVGAAEDFFALGGHSLLATRVMSQVRRTFEVELPLRALFESPTVRGLAERVESAREAGSRGVLPLERVARGEGLALSFGQQRLWFLDQLGEGGAYHVPRAFRLEGELDEEALERSFEEIVRRHESLRTRFVTVDGRAEQRIEEDVQLRLERVDLRGTPDPEGEAQRRTGEEVVRPFDLGTAPLMRASLMRVGPREHVLVVVMHHIVSDGWSMGVLVRELGELYAAHREGRRAHLPELPLQYADHATWQRAWLGGEVLAGQLSYWRERLQGASVLQLPTDRPRPREQQYAGSVVLDLLPAEQLARLRALSQREGVTLFMLLLACFQALLARLTGQADVCVGTPVAGRNRDEVEGLIGFFVNNLVMRADLSGDPSVREILNRVKEACLGAYDHQDLPFEKLVEELQPDRDLGQNPLFQVMFTLQNALAERAAPDGLRVLPLGLEVKTARFELELHVQEWADQLAIALTYRTELFEPETAQGILAQYRRLLERAVADPQARLSGLPLLSEEEEGRVLVEWNATDHEYARSTTVVDLFREQARRSPEAPAVVSGGEALTYGELDRRSGRLARLLGERGVGAEAVVGLLTERSAEMVVGALGVLKAGAAYLPLDPDYPADRLRFTLEDSQVGVVLTQERLDARLPRSGWQVITLDGEANALDEGEGKTVTPAPGPRSLAYVIYTSGSTGQPKGVQLEHGGLVNLVHWHRRVFDVRPGDRATLVASPAFDASVWEMWPYLACGASLHIPDEEVRSSPDRLVAWLTEAGITHTFLPTPLAEAVLEEPGIDGLGLRWLLTGGDRLHRRDRKLPFRFANNYGPTEGTVVATWTEVTPGGEKDPPIGRPIDNTRAYVLDPAMRPVPVGVAGELYVGGDGLARGYPGHPELTAERFVPSPFGPEPGARLYRTGDRVRFLADARLEFLGRIDHQVKIRGFRIEPGEVEWILGQHPRVRDVVVVVRAHGGVEQRLVAYATAREGEELSVSELRTWAGEKLPGHMVPSAVVVLDSLPLSPNGKVDRRALPAPDATSGEAYEPPRTNAEKVLARTWAEVLRLDRVSVHDNFFELGGDSILSIQIVSRANRAGLRLTPRQIFQHQTIASLAAAADAAAPADVEKDVPVGVVPLAPIQRWFLDLHSEADPHHFNQAVLLELQADVPAGRLEQATAALERHHDALRMRFVRSEAGWEQACLEACTPTPVLDLELAELGEEGSRAAIEAAALEAQQGLDLARGPLWRVVRFGRGASPPLVLVVIHHLVVDGVSWRVLLEDLQSACEQLARAGRVSLPPKTTSFRRWTERLREHVQRGGFDQEVAYWRGVVDAGPDPLPVDHEEGRGRNTIATARHVSVTLDQGETRALLQEAPAAYRTRIGDLLLTALLEAFRPWTGSDTLLVDVEGHGREDLLAGVDLSRTVGWFTTIFPVRLAWTGGGPGPAIKAVKEQLRQVPEGGIGFGLLGHLRGEAALRSRSEVLFNYLGQFEDAWGAGTLFAPAGIAAGPTRSGRQRRSHLIEVNGVVSAGRLHVDWLYSEAVHERATVESLARGFEEALRGLIAHCRSGAWGVTPSDFPLAKLDQAALDRVVVGRRQVEDVYPLSPMQEGLLFHALESPTEALYHEQGRYEFEGPLEAPALRRAWELVVERHAVLRTRFAWQGLEHPVQVVERGLPLPWQEEDWRGLAVEERERRFERLLEADRERGFDPARAPLMRLCLVRLENERHRLLWSFHHALLDGWSVPLVLQEVLELHRTRAQSGPVVTAGPQAFRRYMEWLAGQDRDAAERYWRAELAGFRAPTPLGPWLGRARAGAQKTGGGPREVAERLMVVQAETTGRLRRLGRRHGLTLNTLVQGAWAVLLSRYSGERDVLFGVTVSGREASIPGVEQGIGLFINTIPLRLQVDRDRGIPEWLKELQARQEELLRYGHSPLWHVRKWSEVEGGQPLFETLLGFQNYPVDPSLGELATDLRVKSLGIRDKTNYPLVVLAAASGPHLYARLVYDTDRLHPEAVDQIQEHLGRILEGFVVEPTCRLGEISLLEVGEEASLRREASTRPATYPREATVQELFAAQARRTPEAIAIEGGAAGLLYGVLERRANGVAHELRRRGVRRGALVGVCLERSAELVVALLGILKAGAAYVPLDPAYPRQRLAFMAGDAQLRVVLSEEGLRDRVEGLADILDVQELRGESEEAPGVGGSAEDLAYVIYTSGSTGRPKGVAVPHRAVSRLVLGTDYVTLGPEDRVAQASNASFDAATFEIWGALLNGARLVILERDTVLSPRALTAAIERDGITVLFLTTALFNQAVAHAAEGLGRLRCLLFGGEAVDVRAVREARRRARSTRLLHVYGPTENTTFSTFQVVEEAAVDARATTVPIGRSIANSTAFVLDEEWRPVPRGVVGELYVGGDGLARGYLGRAELTAERFVPDPFGTPGGRLYRTGDLVRCREDGSLEFLGRRDHQVKIRGHRIELGEIESVLLGHAAVDQCAVTLAEGAGGERRLAGYVVRRPGLRVGAPELLEHLRGRLPEYMVPWGVGFVEQLPLTPNGKLDRESLLGVELETSGEEAYEEPRGEIERELARIWGQVLRVRRVGARDNFFALGGDSILSIQIIARAAEKGLRLTPKQVFQHQTVRELGRVVGSVGEVEAEQGLVVGDAPLTPIQRWFFERKLDEGHHFNQALLLEIEAGLAAPVVERALAELQRRHDALRLRFRREGGEWRQEFLGESEVPFRRVDLTGLDPAQRPAALAAACDEAQRSVTLESGPVWRAVWIEAGGVGARLLLVIHHLAVDGVSWRVLLSDLRLACGQAARGEAVHLGRKTTSFRAWAERLTEWSGSEELQQELPYWQSLSRASSEGRLVHLESPGDEQGRRGLVGVELDEDATRALLTEVSRAYRTRITEFLLTALLRGFGRRGLRGVRVDVEGHGREEWEGVDLSRTVGWFTTLYPVLLEHEDEGPAESLKRVKECLRRVPRQGLGYGVLRHLSARGEELEGIPEADLSFNYLGQLEGPLGEQPSLRPSADWGASRTAKGKRAYRVDVGGWVHARRLRVEWTYDEGTHPRERIEGLAEAFRAELLLLIEHCRSEGAGGYTPSDFPLSELDARELHAVVGAERDVEDVYPLSPLQQGLLFHSLSGDDSAAYLVQRTFEVLGDVEPAALRRAWQRLVERHGILRTRFVWEGVREPQQVVRQRVDLPWEELDWSQAGEGEQEKLLAELLATERARDLDVTRAPLMRVKSIRTGEHATRLVWTFHHLLLDGWCLPIVIRDLFAQLEAERRGEAVDLGEVVPYRRYIEWQRRQDFGQAERYWRQRLQGASPTVLELEAGDGEGGFDEKRRSLSEETSAGLKELGRRAQLTLGTLVRGAWALVLSRYTGERDVVFGETVSGRPAELAGVESMVGLFINTLPVRVDVGPARRLGEWLAALQDGQAEQRQYEYSPLHRVQAWSGLTAGRRLFDTLFVFENYPASTGGTGGSLQVRGYLASERTHYPLALAASPGARLGLRIAHDRRRFSDATVERMLRHLEVLLDAFVAVHLETPLGALPLPDDTERRRLLAAGCGAAAPALEDSPLLHELVEAQVERTPEATAVVFGDEQLSYRELDRRANRLAWRLRALGVGPDDRVAVCLERSPDLVVALLGILKAGGAYVPLDPDHPTRRLAWMLEDAQVRVLIAAANGSDPLPDASVPRLVLEHHTRGMDAADARPPASGARPGNLAYVLYTSGSTGTPKGAMIPHSAIVNHMQWMQAEFPLDADDAVLQKTPVGFDASVWEFWAPLLAGGRLVLAQPGGHRDGATLVEAVARHRVSVLQVVPTLLHVLLDEPGLSACSSLERVFSGGEPLGAELHDRFRARLDAELVNLYGPTEATIDSVFWRGGAEARRASVPIGRPVRGLRAYVLDRDLQPVPEGVPGELCLAGAGLGRGYLDRPALTAERFVPDPFSSAAGERMYRTGDLVRFGSDGCLHFLRRLDDQVKVRGHRVELGEIEAVLAEHAGVRQAAVALRGSDGVQRLVAYWVPRDGQAPSPSDLRAHLQARLPEALLPSAFVRLATLPLTPSGKVDRRALPEPTAERPDLAQAFVPARSDVEQVLSRIWCEVLGLDSVGVHDNFFELGGDSILSLRVVSRAAREGLKLTPAQLFRHPTIAGLAEVAGRLRAVGAEPGPVNGPLPLTPIQDWFFEGEGKDLHHYNQAFLFEPTRALKADVLERALRTLLEHHDALRLRFVPDPGGWRASFAAPGDPVPLARIDVAAVQAEEQAAAVTHAASELQRSLDLARGPLLRAGLFHLGTRGQRLLLVVHHLVVDAVSWGVLLEDLAAAYRQHEAGAAPRLPAKTTSFKYWAERLAEHARSPAVEAELPHWLHETRPVAATLPLDPPGEGAPANATVLVTLEAKDTRALVLASSRPVEVVDHLLAAVLVAFAEWTGRPELLLDLEGHGRVDLAPEIDVSRTVGWFTALYPVRLRAGSTPPETLQAVREHLRRVPAGGVGYGLLRHGGREDLARQLGGRARAEVLFNYLGGAAAASSQDLLRLAPESTGPARATGSRRHRIEINAAIVGGTLQVAWSAEGLRATTLEALAGRFASALRLLVSARSDDAASAELEAAMRQVRFD